MFFKRYAGHAFNQETMKKISKWDLGNVHKLDENDLVDKYVGIPTIDPGNNIFYKY